MIKMLIVTMFILSMCIVSCYPTNRCSSRSTIKKFASSKEVTVTNVATKTDITIPAGSPLSLAAVRSGIRLSFQCKQGVCSSCETFLDGKRVRTCITKVPDKAKITLQKAPPI